MTTKFQSFTVIKYAEHLTLTMNYSATYGNFGTKLFEDLLHGNTCHRYPQIHCEYLIIRDLIPKVWLALQPHRFSHLGMHHIHSLYGPLVCVYIKYVCE